MSLLSDSIEAIKGALTLADEVRRASATLDEMAIEIRNHDRRITRLEAQWETALALSSRKRLDSGG